MPDISLNDIRLVRIEVINGVVSGMPLELKINITHTVSSLDPISNRCNAVTKIELSQQNADPLSPFNASLELRSSFSATTPNISAEDIFDQSANLVFPYLQSHLHQLLAMLSIAPFELPANAIPKYPK